MSSPTMRSIVPDEWIPFLAAIGPDEWLKLHHRPDVVGRYTGTLRLPEDARLRRYGGQQNVLRQLAAAGLSSALLHLYALSKLLASGPKLLSPTDAQCEAMDHVDVNVSIDDYEQPFAAFLVELPSEYRRRLRERHGAEPPRFVLAFHERTERYLFVIPEHGFAKDTTFCLISAARGWGSIEEALRYTAGEDGPGFRVGEAAMRVAINFALLLTRYGVRDCGPVNPTAHEKQVRNAGSKNVRKAERARRLLDATIHRIEFQQEVVFCERVSRGGAPVGHGPLREPHWRRGHFRRVPFGSGRRGRRITFIRPVMVNAELFGGDAADTSYLGRSVDPPDTGPPTGRTPAKPR